MVPCVINFSSTSTEAAIGMSIHMIRFDVGLVHDDKHRLNLVLALVC